MNGFEAYKIYAAIKLHFSSKSYDVIASRGAMRGLTFEAFSKKREAKWFTFIAKKFDSGQQFAKYVVASGAYGSVTDIFDLQTSSDNNAKWAKCQQMSTRLISDELDSFDSLDELLDVENPKIVKMLIAKKVSVHTLVAIDKYYPDMCDQLLSQDYLILSKEALRIRKLGNFVKYNTDQINLLLSEKMSLNTKSTQ